MWNRLYCRLQVLQHALQGQKHSHRVPGFSPLIDEIRATRSETIFKSQVTPGDMLCDLVIVKCTFHFILSNNPNLNPILSNAPKILT